jgi:NADH dehydrogenase
MTLENGPLSICVLGGTGFVGTELVTRLVSERHRVRVITRRAEHARHLMVLPTVEIVAGDAYDSDFLSRQFAGMDVVINLVGILNERGRDGSGFRRAHVTLVETVVAVARRERVQRLLQMSALGADAEHAPSFYLRSKGAAERVVRGAGDDLDYTIFRPSVIFGPGDSFINRFAQLLRLARGLMPLPGAGVRFAPVYVGDVVAAFRLALRGGPTSRETYELCGPQILSLEAIIRFIATTLGRGVLVLPVPRPVARVQAWFMDFLPGKPFSTDNWRSLQRDSVCVENGCARLGIRPTYLAAIVPDYLGGRGREARLERFRARD